MNLGNRHAGIRIERPKWGMPARLTVYAGRDPYAGQGTIPWRHYWARDLRSPLVVRLLYTFEPRFVQGFMFVYGLGSRRRSRTWQFPRPILRWLIRMAERR